MISYFLSVDATHSADDVRVASTALAPLQPGQTRLVKRKLNPTSSFAPRGKFVLAVAQSGTGQMEVVAGPLP